MKLYYLYEGWNRRQVVRALKKMPGVTVEPGSKHLNIKSAHGVSGLPLSGKREINKSYMLNILRKIGMEYSEFEKHL